MRPNRSMPDCLVIPELAYPDIAAAIEWLTAAFGFELRLRFGDHRAQISVGKCCVILTELRNGDPQGFDAGSRRFSVLTRTEHIDEHHQRAAGYGAIVTGTPANYHYGERQYSCIDLGGHLWTFSETIADISPVGHAVRSHIFIAARLTLQCLTNR